MTRRVPLIPTVIVAAGGGGDDRGSASGSSIRKPQKEAALAQLAANPALPEIAFPRLPDDALLFRRAHGYCASRCRVKLDRRGQCRVSAPSSNAAPAVPKDPAGSSSSAPRAIRWRSRSEGRRVRARSATRPTAVRVARVLVRAHAQATAAWSPTPPLAGPRSQRHARPVRGAQQPSRLRRAMVPVRARRGGDLRPRAALARAESRAPLRRLKIAYLATARPRR